MLTSCQLLRIQYYFLTEMQKGKSKILISDTPWWGSRHARHLLKNSSLILPSTFNRNWRYTSRTKSENRRGQTLPHSFPSLVFCIPLGTKISTTTKQNRTNFSNDDDSNSSVHVCLTDNHPTFAEHAFFWLSVTRTDVQLETILLMLSSIEQSKSASNASANKPSTPEG